MLVSQDPPGKSPTLSFLVGGPPFLPHPCKVAELQALNAALIDCKDWEWQRATEDPDGRVRLAPHFGIFPSKMARIRKGMPFMN